VGGSLKHFIFLTVLLLSTESFGSVSITSVNNSSNDVLLKELMIMGGTAGIEKCRGEITTLNTCAMGSDRSACNFRTVCPTTMLSLTMNSTSSGIVALVDSENNLIHNFGYYAPGKTTRIEISWSEICKSIMGDASCALEPTKGMLKLSVIGKDSEDYRVLQFKVSGMGKTSGESLANIDGVSDYSIFPGNQKAVLRELSVAQDFSVYEAGRIVALRGFFTEGSCAQPLAVTTASNSYLLNLDRNKNIMDNRLLNLKNGTRYLFMFGFQDEMGNVGLFKDLSSSCIDNKHSVMPGNGRN
jgi:hypothetical protein